MFKVKIKEQEIKCSQKLDYFLGAFYDFILLY